MRFIQDILELSPRTKFIVGACSIFVLFLAIFSAGFFAGSRPHDSATHSEVALPSSIQVQPNTGGTSEQLRQDPSSDIINIDAVDLAKAFDTDSEAAEKKFSGKFLRISGTVENTILHWDLGADLSHNSPTIMLKGYKERMPVYAFFKKAEQDSILKISPGDRIVMVCIRSGQGELAAVDECVLG